MKKVSLRTFMFIQAAIAFCIPLYYHLMVAFKVHSNLPLLIAVLILILINRLKSRSEVIDEYAERTLQIADSICFKFSIVVMGILILPFLFISNVHAFLIGYLLTFGIFTLILVRAFVFYCIDKKGME